MGHGVKAESKKTSRRWSADDFDLREEVMSCIAKSIGLLQPPLSGSDSVEASPAFTSTDSKRVSTLSDFSSPFTSLSLLDVGDDLSSLTGSSSIASNGNYMSGLNNEVEILFYPAGSILAKAGETSTGTWLTSVSFKSFSSTTIGLFYVIEGFLDILLPVKEQGKDEPSAFRTSDAEAWRYQGDSKQRQKLLFTVKPGGIAGYLGKFNFRWKQFELLTVP